MKHTICCIDDKIPVSDFPEYFDDTKILDGQVISFLLNSDESQWEDSVVKELFERLLNDENDEWFISAFTAPSFYENYNSEVVFSPDVIVFDWDYNNGSGSEDSAKSLLKILQESYSIVFILSGADNISAIKAVVSEPSYYRFKDRLEVVAKEKGKGVDIILELFKKREESLFIYKYGYYIVRQSNRAINRILSDISLLSVPGFISAIGKEDRQGFVASGDDFIDAMIPRFRYALSGVKMGEFRVSNEEGMPNIDEIREVWKYRLYGEISDGRVAMGDIVLDERANMFYIVFSSDCHMNNLWKKNGGYVSLIPLLKVNEPETKKLIKQLSANKFSISSLTSSQWAITILPAVPVDDLSLVDFAVFPKGIKSVRIDKKDENQENTLKYQYWDGFRRIVSILDPFKSPLMHFLQDNITGYGCPDFHSALKEYIADAVK